MSEPTNYTVSDIERYYQGGMTAAEMHRLEEAALDDPVLADMLDGYRNTASPVADLQRLQQRLQQRIAVDHRKASPVYRLQWLKVAALLLLFAGAGWVVFQTFSEQREVSALARKNTAEKTKDVAAKTDTITAALTTGSNSSPGATLQKRDETTAAARSSIGQKNGIRQNQSDKNPTSDRAAKKETSQNQQTAPALLSTTAGYTDSLAGATAEAKPAPLARRQPDTLRNLNITLQPANLPMEEVVIAKRKLEPQANRRSILDTLKPENGWEAFDDYVAENIQSPEELAETPASSREVELSFQVDRGGKPRNITITKSLCKKCDTEAVRLLKEGPKWKGKKGKVKILFPNNR